MLEALAKDDNENVRVGVAVTPRRQRVCLKAWRRTRNRSVRHSVANNPGRRSAALEALAKDKDVVGSAWCCRELLDAACARLLEALAKDKEEWVRHGVAENPLTPPRLLEALAKDKDEWFGVMLPRTPRRPNPCG